MALNRPHGNSIINFSLLSLPLNLNNLKMIIVSLLNQMTPLLLPYQFTQMISMWLIIVFLPSHHSNTFLTLNLRSKILDVCAISLVWKLPGLPKASTYAKKNFLDILADTGMLGSKPLQLPLEQNLKLSKSFGNPLLDPSLYRRLMGRLLYLTIIKPDICYVVQFPSQFMDHPTTFHFVAAQKILRYIRASPAQGLLLSSFSPFQLKAYCDFDWISCCDTCQSYTQYCILLSCSLIS